VKGPRFTAGGPFWFFAYLPFPEVTKTKFLMRVKNTFNTLFEISDSGMTLLADFVSRGDAEEFAAANGIKSYTILETVVVHEAEPIRQEPTQPARSARGEINPGGDQEQMESRSGPITGIRDSLGRFFKTNEPGK
jgi:hypothetical protein